MKAITFLGLGNYETTTYRWQGKECETIFFAEALCRIVLAAPPAELLVLATKEAKAKHSVSFRKAIPAEVPLKIVDIPSGRSEEELWEMFARLTSCLETGDRVVFDITHGFRHQPMLALLAASFLRVARQVTLEGIYYGAFEAKEPVTNITPVFDLTPFLTLFEWTAATDQFLKTGDARALAERLRHAHHEVRRHADPASNLPVRMQSFASTLDQLSQAQALARPREVQPIAKKLGDQIDEVEAEAARWARPFTLLLDRVRADFAPMAVPEHSPLRVELMAQLRQIDHYLERDQAMQAVTLAREWVVSVLCHDFGFEAYVISERQRVERALNQLAPYGRAHEDRDESGSPDASAGPPLEDRLAGRPDIKSLRDLWARLRDIRNDLDHCGMRESPLPSKKLVSGALELQPKLHSLAQQFDLHGEDDHAAA